jgi:hypothetical protein
MWQPPVGEAALAGLQEALDARVVSTLAALAEPEVIMEVLAANEAKPTTVLIVLFIMALEVLMELALYELSGPEILELSHQQIQAIFN